MDKDQGEMTLASTEWSDLPRHLQFNILSRLPVNSLGRCRCVAKDWGQLVDDPIFLKLQFDMAETRQLFLLGETFLDEEHHFCFMSANMEGEVNFAVCKDNGKFVNICQIPSWYGLVGLIIDTKFCVYNPTTREMKELPDMQPSLTDYERIANVRFGYDSSTNEYKVVHLFHRSEDRSNSVIRAELLTLSDGGVTNGWRELHESCPFKVYGRAVMTNKKFYWIILTKDAYGKIMYLDLETETFDVISNPNMTSYGEIILNEMFLIVMNCELSLVDFSRKSCVADIWILKDPVSLIWEKQYCIDFNVLREISVGWTVPDILGYHNGKLVTKVVNDEGGSLAFYDVKRKIFTGDVTVIDDRVGVCLYTDSYFSLGTL